MPRIFTYMKIYTKTGDNGTTSVFSGKRVSKAHLQVEAAGQLDEATCSLGLALQVLKNKDLQEQLLTAQQNLYTIMSYVSGAKVDLSNLLSDCKKLEQNIDKIWTTLPELHAFILPGGGEVSSRLHMSRALVRSAERSVVRYYIEDSIETKEVSLILQYINRLSDYLFATARKTADTEVRTK